MNRLKWGWSLISAVFALPYLILFVVGSIWLWERSLLWAWGLAALACTLIAWPLTNWVRRASLAAADSSAGPSERWPPAAEPPWKAIDALAQRIQAEDPPLDQPQRWLEIFRETLSTVAREYHPRSSAPALEIPVPQALRVAELVAADLRKAFVENVPGAHIITLHDMRRLKRWAVIGRRLYFLYRVLQFPINPVAAVLREARDFSTDKLAGASIEEIKRWALGFCVRRAGYYAIELYSGHLVLDERGFETYRSPETRRDLAQLATAEARPEPLRVLVAGQVKSGKSSLLNALFDAPRAAVDVVPCTQGVTPYLLERDAVPQAVILDTAGYADVDAAQKEIAQLRDESLACDLVIMVCSARSAARAADRRWLDGLRASLAAKPERTSPPVIVALSYIDQVRPLAEWSPPYDLAAPPGEKARNIRDAMQAVAADLACDVADVVPVCLRADRVYNVEEALLPALMQALPAALKAKFLRCLRSYHNEQFWRQLWTQAARSGRLLLRAGASWIAEKSRR